MLTIYNPVVDGPYRAMKMALDMAGDVNVDYINAHGNKYPCK